MPSANVRWPLPLTRQNQFFPGMQGVAGTDNRTGLRQHSTGAVFYVDPNYPGAVVGRDGTNPTNPLPTVASALALCQPYRGDVICVAANNSWQYGDPADLYATAIVEEVTIDVPGVRLVGVSQSSPMGVYWTPASNAGTCITVTALDVLIEGFCFTEGDYTGCDAIFAEWDGVTLWADNLVVQNCTFDDTVDTAISIDYAWWCDIHDNAFWQCDTYGITSPVAGSGVAYCTIHDNIFHDCAKAISLLGGCDDNHVYRNSIYSVDAQNAAVATNDGIDTTGGDNNQVYDNFLSCLLPVPANGDYDDFCSAAATDAWINNRCMDGPSVTNPT